MESIKDLDEKSKSDIIGKLDKLSEDAVRYCREKWSTYRLNKHVGPVVAIVAGLPKDELAAMAESLVNLTSFKRKVSAQDETVGGPIDVAVISKGDGFIWIKRKQYFKSELNPRFVSKYYGEVQNDQE